MNKLYNYNKINLLQFIRLFICQHKLRDYLLGWNITEVSCLSSRKRPAYSNEFKLNIGTIIFMIIFLYVVIRIIMSLQKESLSIYEVQNSYIDTNISATALIVRDEALIKTDSSGYVSYYVRDGQRVGKNKTIYTIDETGSVYEKIKEKNEDILSMSNESLTDVRTRISNYENYFDYSRFSDVYNFRYDIENAVLELTNEALIEQLTSLDDEKNISSTYKKVNTPESGIVTYYQDGYEKFNINSFKSSDLDKSQYKKKTLKTGEILNVGDPVYKLITSENWKLIIPLTKSQVNQLKDRETLRINIHNSSRDIRCPFELKEMDGETFAILSLNQQMVNYINDRFIDIVIMMDQNNGLKIPNTSITKKEVYKIPVSYLSNGSDSQEKEFFNVKILNDKGEVSVKQIKPTIYKTDDKYAYADPNDFSTDTVLVNTTTNDTFPLSKAKKKKLDGVFCVNQGVAAFRYIEILFQDDEYTIVKDNVNYSIAWYDRIVLNHSLVSENQIIK